MKEKAAELLAISGSILLVSNALFNEAFAADTSKAPAKGVAKATLRTPTKAPGVDSIDTYIKLVSPKI